MFVHLNLHSYYSLLRGTASPEEICRAVKEMGMETLALTDTNGLYGMVLFLEAAADYGLKPIIGAEVHSGGERAVALVKNRRGYENLCHLLSERHLKEDFDLLKHLPERAEGLVILTASQRLLTGLRDRVEDLYAEVVPGREGYRTLQFAGERLIPPAATNRVHFLVREDYPLHRLLRAIDGNTTFSRLPPSEVESQESYLKSPRQMQEALFFCPEALKNTEKIALKCDYRPGFRSIFPQFEDYSPEESVRLLRKRAYQGAEKRYGRISEAVRSRLEHELALIEEKNFASLFLVVQDIVQQSPRTCGRGSAAASLVA